MTEICTIGYEGRGQHDVLELLVDARVELLVDVRIRAQSRKPGFSKSTLAAGLATVDIEYLHLRELGTPLDIRDEFRSGDIATARERYREYLRSDPDAQQQLAQLADLAGTRRVAMLCFEHDWRGCHRAVIAEELLEHWSITADHLGAPSVAR
jgi:uncharacterized protein (DUF488 family)